MDTKTNMSDHREYHLYPFTYTTYIPTPSNSFLTTLPPPHSHGTLGRNVATSHVHTATTCTIVSHSQVSLVFSRGHIPISRSSCGP